MLYFAGILLAWFNLASKKTVYSLGKHGTQSSSVLFQYMGLLHMVHYSTCHCEWGHTEVYRLAIGQELTIIVCLVHRGIDLRQRQKECNMLSLTCTSVRFTLLNYPYRYSEEFVDFGFHHAPSSAFWSCVQSSRIFVCMHLYLCSHYCKTRNISLHLWVSIARFNQYHNYV